MKFPIILQSLRTAIFNHIGLLYRKKYIHCIDLDRLPQLYIKVQCIMCFEFMNMIIQKSAEYYYKVIAVFVDIWTKNGNSNKITNLKQVADRWKILMPSSCFTFAWKLSLIWSRHQSVNILLRSICVPMQLFFDKVTRNWKYNTKFLLIGPVCSNFLRKLFQNWSSNWRSQVERNDRFQHYNFNIIFPIFTTCTL